MKVVALVWGGKRLVAMGVCWEALREFRVEVGLMSDRDGWQDGLIRGFN